MKPLIKEAGFEDVRKKTLKMPLGTWPAERKQKEIGAYFLLVAETGFEALGLAFLTRVLGMGREEVEALIQRCKNEVKSRKVHGYIRQ